MKFHDNIPKGIEVMEWSRNCIWNHKGEISEKVWKWELSFYYTTHCHDLFYISVKYHVIYQRVLKLWSRHILHQKSTRGNNSESMKVRVVILVCDTSAWPVLPNCEVSWLYSKGYSSYRADINMHKKASKGRSLKKYESQSSHFCMWQNFVMTCST